MQLNMNQLAKRAISAALKLNWDEAVKLNLEILEREPTDTGAKLRLGRAYTYIKDFPKAKKVFKEVLTSDPINQVALKNLELINSNSIHLAKDNNVDPRTLIKEPGTTTEITLELCAKGLRAESLVPGETFKTIVKKKSIELYRIANKRETLIAVIDDLDIVSRVDQKSLCNVNFIRGHDKTVTMLLRCTQAVFKSDKQDVRPYIKKGSLDEGDPENEEMELALESETA